MHCCLVVFVCLFGLVFGPCAIFTLLDNLWNFIIISVKYWYFTLSNAIIRNMSTNITYSSALSISIVRIHKFDIYNVKAINLNRLIVFFLLFSSRYFEHRFSNEHSIYIRLMILFMKTKRTFIIFENQIFCCIQVYIFGKCGRFMYFIIWMKINRA